MKYRKALYPKFNIVIRFFVAFTFILSGILKLLSIDSFEIYVYSFGFLSLNQTFLFSRILISSEIILGLLLMFGIYIGMTRWTTIILLGVFSCFIVYLIIANVEEHCHCFGEHISLSHATSLIKNIVLISLLLLVRKGEGLFQRYKAIIFLVSLIIGLAIPLIYSPPDFVRFDSYSSMVKYDVELLDEFVVANDFGEGDIILCFFGSSCKYCKLAAKKLRILAERNPGMSNMHFVFWGSEESVNLFRTETNTAAVDFSVIDPPSFLRITNGKMPLVIKMSEGKILSADNYRSIDEREYVKLQP